MYSENLHNLYTCQARGNEFLRWGDPNVSTDCDGIKIGRGNFANAERETKSPKQVEPLPLLRANRKQAKTWAFLG